MNAETTALMDVTERLMRKVDAVGAAIRNQLAGAGEKKSK
jgi:hypothetical protein